MDKDKIVRIISLALAVYQRFAAPDVTMEVANMYEEYINSPKNGSDNA